MSAINTSPFRSLHTLWLRKFQPNGTPDLSFGATVPGNTVPGAVLQEFYRWGSDLYETAQIDNMVVKIQPSDGKIVVAAKCHGIVPFPFGNGVNLGGDLCLFRFNQNGTLDTTFGGNSVVARAGSNTTTYNFSPGKVFTITGENTQNTDVRGMEGYPTDIEIGADG